MFTRSCIRAARQLSRATQALARQSIRPSPLSSSSSAFHTSAPLSSGAGIVQHRDTPDNTGTETWSFSAANEPKVKYILSKFPNQFKQSAVMPLLTLAQEQNDNWLPLAAMNKIAEMLNMAPIRVYEVATFYSMYNRTKMGKYHLQVCGTTPCQLCGAEEIISTLEKHLNVHKGDTTADGMFTLSEVECLGACANAPMLQVNNHEFYENLTADNVRQLVDDLKAGKKVKIGPQTAQRVAEGPQGKTSLFEEPKLQTRDLDAVIKQAKEDAEKAKQAAAAGPPKA